MSQRQNGGVSSRSENYAVNQPMGVEEGYPHTGLWERKKCFLDESSAMGILKIAQKRQRMVKCFDHSTWAKYYQHEKTY